MPRLSRVHHDTLHQVRQLAGRALLPEQLGGLLLEALQKAIPSDIRVLVGVDPASLLFNRLLALDAGDTSDFWYWLEHIYLVREPTFALAFPGLMHAGLSAVVLQDRMETCWGVPKELFHPLSEREFTGCYHEICAPAGGILRVCFAVDGRYIAALEMHRLQTHPSFHPTDVAFLRLIAPLIGRALRAAFDRERANLVSDNFTNPETRTGVLILSPAKTVTMATPAGQYWLDRLGSRERGGTSHLPTAVVSALASLSAYDDSLLPRTVRVATPTGPLRIEAALAGADGSMAVTLVPEHVRTPLQVPDSWPLSPRERQVCVLLLRGQSNREIAKNLVVSENTVESHCGHVYEKLRVQSRTELLGRFFQEVSYPELNYHWKGRL